MNILSGAHKKITRAVSLLLCTVTAMTAACFAAASSAGSVSVKALDDPIITDTSSAYLYNITNDIELYSKNAELTVYPASTVKIMFALVALEQWDGIDFEITVTRDMVRGVTGNNINLRADEVVRFVDMINCVVVGGSNDCANVVAYSLLGSPEAFVEKMNQKAVALGMYDTHYTNVTGMHDPEMVTTLSDVVKLAKYAIVQYDYFDMAKQYKYEMDKTNRSGTRKVYTRNAFLTSYYTSLYYSPDVSGINAGSTSEAGYCAVVTAENNGTSYLAIAMGSGSEGDNIYSFTTIRSMLDWAYENFSYVTVVKSTDVIREIPVSMSASYDRVPLFPEHSVDVFMEGDIDVSSDIKRTVILLSDTLEAPLRSGEAVGFLTLSHEDKVLSRVKLVVKNDVPQSELLYLASLLEEALHTDFFKICAVLAAITFASYVALKIFAPRGVVREKDYASSARRRNYPPMRRRQRR